MRKETALANLLRGLVDLISDEAARNPEFAASIENLLLPLPERSVRAKKAHAPKQPLTLPDIHRERDARGSTEFRLWLRDQPIPVLRGLIRQHDLDAAHRTGKWKEAEKLSGYIADQLDIRAERGSSFLRGTDGR
jgi:hypothetical protein